MLQTEKDILQTETLYFEECFKRRIYGHEFMRHKNCKK